MADNIETFVKNAQDIMRYDAGVNGDAQRIEQLSWLLFLNVYNVKEESWMLDDIDNYHSIIPEGYHWDEWAQDDSSGKALTGDELIEFVNNDLLPTLKDIPTNANNSDKQVIVPEIFSDVNNYMKDGVQLRKLINSIDALDLADDNNSFKFNDIYETILKDLQSQRSSGEFYTPRALTDFISEEIHPKLGESIADLACGTGGFLISALHQLRPQVQNTDQLNQYGSSVHGIEKKAFPYLLAITNLLLHGIDEPDLLNGNSLTHNVTEFSDDQKYDVIMMNPPFGGTEQPVVQNNFPQSLRSSETADLFIELIMYRLKADGRAGMILPDSFLFDTSDVKKNIKAKLFHDFNVTTIVRLPKGVFAPYTDINTNLLFFRKDGKSTESTWFYRVDLPKGLQSFSKTRPLTSDNLNDLRKWWKDKKEITNDEDEKAKQVSIDDIQKNDYDLSYLNYGQKEENIPDPKTLLHDYLAKKQALDKDIDVLTHEVQDILGDDHHV